MPAVWKVVYSDGEVEVVFNIEGPYAKTDPYWASGFSSSGYPITAKGKSLWSCLLKWWLASQGYGIAVHGRKS
jgi:hypothetical protein